MPLDDTDGRDDILIVGIGASAGGLEACTRLVGAMPARPGMAFILVQHLDPTHDSMMVELLARHTPLSVRQAAEGIPIERDNLYVIPPGHFLSVRGGAMHLSTPQGRRGRQLPFDFLLHSLAEEFGSRTICVVLSGTGGDGSLGLRSIKETGGLVIAQDPGEADAEGMPRSAIASGAVDLVLPAAEIPDAVVRYRRRTSLIHTRRRGEPNVEVGNRLAEVIQLLRTKTRHDFTSYKEGTLRRRIERRMALATTETDDVDLYLDVLRNDPLELKLLVKDLLINVTSFFRDAKVFDLLEKKIIPELVRGHGSDRPLRVWVAACSTGEEVYSLGMLLKETIATTGREIELQVFASDVDAAALAIAREGLYPDNMETAVSSSRRSRFFTREEGGYRVSVDLRASVIFAAQDILGDPPFSKIDLISCRNLLIYLAPDAQAKVISLCGFALREGGVLVLGSAESAGADKSFDVISKAERIYRRSERSRPAEPRAFGRADPSDGGFRSSAMGPAPSRKTDLAELCKKLVLDGHAPAAVLVNRRLECLYTLGPTSRYLSVPSGRATHDVLAMAHRGIRTKLRSAIQQSKDENALIVTAGGQVERDGSSVEFDIAVRPVSTEDQDLLLICFVETPVRRRDEGRPATPLHGSHAIELERELLKSKADLLNAERSLEAESEQYKATIDEALSINEEFQATNEEFQATNEELLTSKEELQSLNEELTTVNSLLKETLKRQRTTFDDLQNVLYSSDVATLFLDGDLRIRLFTPTVKALFHIIPTDIGRPLADLRSLVADDALLTDARSVLENVIPVDREIEAAGGIWFMRRVLPYRSQDNGAEGVVITFVDVTERKRAATKLEVAEREAQSATVAKSRFLAAASHDLRQPLQTLVLLQSLLAERFDGEEAKSLVSRLDKTLGTMSGILNTLLDINQIEAGVVRVDVIDFRISGLIESLRDEFAHQAQARGIGLRVVHCNLLVRSDPRLLDQMIRNLISNALKYTPRGRVLIGCRRRGGKLSVEVWDTGRGIPPEELGPIFDEYHQLENSPRERNRGLGLGLSIVQRLGKLLEHRIHVNSRTGKGSVFAIEIERSFNYAKPQDREADREADEMTASFDRRVGAILVVEDDPDTCHLLEAFLKDDGHETATAPDGVAALALVAEGQFRPDMVLADYNLPNDINGIELTLRLRKGLRRETPVIILTGDIATETLVAISNAGCVHLNKPVKAADLRRAIQRILPPPQRVAVALPLGTGTTAADTGQETIFVVDDDRDVRNSIRALLEANGRVVEDFVDGEAFLDGYRSGHRGCLLIDAILPGISGLQLLLRVREAGAHLPAIMLTGNGDVQMAVRAMKAGALDFIEKPVGSQELLASIARALATQNAGTSSIRRISGSDLAGLTSRQREVLALILEGLPNKNIAAELGISQRAVESHRALIMRNSGSKSLPALVRLAFASGWTQSGLPPADESNLATK